MFMNWLELFVQLRLQGGSLCHYSSMDTYESGAERHLDLLLLLHAQLLCRSSFVILLRLWRLILRSFCLFRMDEWRNSSVCDGVSQRGSSLSLVLDPEFLMLACYHDFLVNMGMVYSLLPCFLLDQSPLLFRVSQCQILHSSLLELTFLRYKMQGWMQGEGAD